MRLVRFVLPLVVVAGPCLATPLAFRQPQPDPWDVGYSPPTAHCERIRSELAFEVPPARREDAARMLAMTSVRRLSDSAAAVLLQTRSADHLLARLIDPVVEKMEGQRRTALVDHLGSWSDEDTVTVSDLVDAAQPHYPPYRPYLVRAFRGDRTKLWDGELTLCGNALFVNTVASGEGAVRSPLVVFLQSPPTTATPSLWLTPAPAAP